MQAPLSPFRPWRFCYCRRVPIPDAVSLLRALVAEPSVSSPDPRFDQSNRGVIDRLATFAEDVGAAVEVRELPGGGGKANLIARLGPEAPDGLVLAGHADTVPFDADRWASDPFALTELEGGLLRGLGSADMKGFFAAALRALVEVDPATLRRPVYLVATADEESSMAGARRLVEERALEARHCVIGEPTSLVPVYKHKGILLQLLRLEGRSGHSSDPKLGASALEAMSDALDALRSYRRSIASAVDPDFAVPEPTLNLGRIEGGDSPNRICASCSLTFDLRFGPDVGLDPESVESTLKRALEERLSAHEVDMVFESLVPPTPAFGGSAAAPIVAAVARRRAVAPEAVMFCTEAPYFAELGMDVVVSGPGSIDVAHQPNEHTSREQLSAAEGLYRELVEEFCVDG